MKLVVTESSSLRGYATSGHEPKSSSSTKRKKKEEEEEEEENALE